MPGQGTEKLEIFEAGTGHGALTMFLSRAIHAANTAFPMPAIGEEGLAQAEEYNQWLLTRRAVIHTLDISEAHSQHAQGTIKNFRRGIYYHNIDFHTGTIDNYLKPRLQRDEPFLDHAILDLPDTHLNMNIVCQAMKENSTMITFCPSITQTSACLELVKREQLPLFLECVLEVGGLVGVGGREWDVRRVKVKSRGLAQGTSTAEQRNSQSNGNETHLLEAERTVVGEPGTADGIAVRDGSLSSQSVAVQEPADRWEMVCRPKVGGRLVGGGFVGLWRKKVF